MEIGAVLLLFVVIVAVGFFIAKPLLLPWRLTMHSTQRISTLLAERERTINALSELDFDNRMGKIPQDEYAIQRANLIRKGSETLRQLDEIEQVQSTPAMMTVQQSVADHCQKQISDEELEDLISKRRSIQRQKTAGFCPHCGKPVLQSDQFCSSCGFVLTHSEQI